MDTIKMVLGTRVLNGLNIHLLLHITIEKKEEGYKFTLKVPISGYFPKSALFSSPIVHEVGLFNAVIETVSSKDMLKYCDAQNKLGFTTSLGLYLKSMYIASKHVTVTSEERIMLMGLERQVFYISLQYLSNKYNINTFDTIIMCDLEESCESNDPRVNKYLTLDYETLVEYYRNICPRKSPKRLTTTHEELAKRIVCHEDSMKKRLYLSTMLAMKRVDDDTMATLLSIFMEKCMPS